VSEAKARAIVSVKANLFGVACKSDPIHITGDYTCRVPPPPFTPDTLSPGGPKWQTSGIGFHHAWGGWKKSTKKQFLCQHFIW